MSFTFTLELHDLKLKAKLGVFDWERASEREFLAHVTAQIKAEEAITEDNLQSTLDYAKLEQFLLTHAAAQEWQLIERLLESLARHTLEQFPQIEHLFLTLHKPQALEQSDVAVSYALDRKRLA